RSAPAPLRRGSSRLPCHRPFLPITWEPCWRFPARGNIRRPAERCRGVKIATYNVNGVNGRLPVLLRWLELRQPDVVCLQELKAPDEKFPEKAIRDLGYDAIWHGQARWNGVAILSRVGEIHETRRGLPKLTRDDPEDSHSRYLEAAVNGLLIGGLYLPNGNPRPGPDRKSVV